MLSDLIEEKLIIPELSAEKKKDVLKQICNLFTQAGIVEDLGQFIKVIEAREAIESTAIGEGIAIPHGRSATVKRLAVAFAKSSKGVDFEALDGKPVHLIFMIAAPEEARREYLQAVAKIARLLKIKDLRQKLLQATDKGQVMKVIEEFDSKFPARLEVKTQQGRVIYKT